MDSRISDLSFGHFTPREQPSVSTGQGVVRLEQPVWTQWTVNTFVAIAWKRTPFRRTPSQQSRSHIDCFFPLIWWNKCRYICGIFVQTNSGLYRWHRSVSQQCRPVHSGVIRDIVHGWSNFKFAHIRVNTRAGNYGNHLERPRPLALCHRPETKEKLLVSTFSHSRTAFQHWTFLCSETYCHVAWTVRHDLLTPSSR